MFEAWSTVAIVRAGRKCCSKASPGAAVLAVHRFTSEETLLS